jgi:hypothetical protein
MLLYATLLYATLRYSTLLVKLTQLKLVFQNSESSESDHFRSLSLTVRYATLLYATLRYSTLLYASGKANTAKVSFSEL